MEIAVQKSDQLGSDLLQPPPVGDTLLLQEPGDLGGGFHHGLREVLDFQIHHFLDQLHNCLGVHKLDSVGDHHFGGSRPAGRRYRVFLSSILSVITIAESVLAAAYRDAMTRHALTGWR